MENKECKNCRLYDSLYLKLDFDVYLETNYGRCRKDCIIKKCNLFGDVKKYDDVCEEWKLAENNFPCRRISRKV